MRQGGGAARALRVLYDYGIFRVERHGGISRYATEVARRVAATGQASVTLLAGLHRNDHVAALPQTPGLRVVWRTPAGGLARAPVGALVNQALLEVYGWLADRADIFHPTYYSRWPTRRPRGSRLVVTVYDMIPELFPQYFPNDPSAERKRRLVAEADLVLCISRRTADDVRAICGVDEAKLRVTYLAADLPSETPPLAEPQHAPGQGIYDPTDALDPPPRFLLFVGKRGAYKNFAALLDAYLGDPTLKGVTRLVCFGGGPFTEAERATIRSARAERYVRQVNGDDRALAEQYRSARALVVPSLYEGFGLPLLEAMAAGTPVVANDAGAMPEVLGGAGRLCDCRDVAALREALRAVVFDDDEHSRLRKAGRVRAAQFSWDRTARETLRAYLDVAGEG